MNIAQLQQETYYLTVSSRQRAKIHPSSVLNNKARPQCIIFNELVSSARNYVRTVTVIDPEWVEEILPNSDIANRIGHNLHDESRKSVSYIS